MKKLFINFNTRSSLIKHEGLYFKYFNFILIFLILPIYLYNYNRNDSIPEKKISTTDTLNLKQEEIFKCFIENLNNKPFNKKFYLQNPLILNDTMAIKIAEIFADQHFKGYGIEYQKPFKAFLINGKFWRVVGVLPKNAIGGFFMIDINKNDGKILFIGHGK